METIKKCKKCGTAYDRALQECPKCHTKNEQADKKAKNVSFIPVEKQYAFFLIGLVGLILISVVFTSGSTVLLYLLRGKAAALEVVETPMFQLITQLVTYGLALQIMLIIMICEYKKVFFTYKKIGSYIAGILAAAVIIGFELYYASIFEAFAGKSLPVGGNQQEIFSILNASPVISIIVFVIVGPAVEELTYRVGLFSLLRRNTKVWAYIVTSLLFALIHIVGHIGGGNLLNELLVLPNYIVAGLVLTFIYDKFGLAASLTAHMIVNLISIL